MIPARARRGAGALLAVTVLSAGALAIGGCGDDDNGDTTPAPAPNISQEGTETRPGKQAPDQGTGGTTAAPEGPDRPESSGGGGSSGGAQAPAEGAATEDTPTSDVPPEPGGAQERFEQFCEQFPEACR